MQLKQDIQNQSSQNIFQPHFPIQYNKQSNIYRLLDNSFANRLFDLHVGNKKIDKQTKSYEWYLHLEQALYLISVSDILENQEDNNIREKMMKEIYKNCNSQDINTLHFYLTIRKRNKLCRRIDSFFLESQQNLSQSQKQKLKNQINLCRFFKIYEVHEDWKSQKNQKVFLLVSTEQSISSIMFNTAIDEIKALLKCQTLNLCIFDNHDFVIIDVKDFEQN